MVRTQEIPFEGGPLMGVELHLFAVNLILIKARAGFVMCGYLNLDVATRVEDVACTAKGRVNTVEEVMATTVNLVTPGAAALGISPGMPIPEALKLMNR
ncbi:MAG: DUF1805 domain-containing protein [Candidatus Latescibacteria bacterium]|nr:DUF1805 domain-containing protein [Candidatus Latescibacterota bacterium]